MSADCEYNKLALCLTVFVLHITICVFVSVLLLQVRAGSRALYRPLSASVLSRPETKTEVRGNGTGKIVLIHMHGHLNLAEWFCYFFN